MWKQALYDGIGRMVKTKRSEKNLTLRTVAIKLGLSYQAVLRIEEGLGAPTHFLVSFAALVGCTVSDLIPPMVVTFNHEIEKSDG